MSDETSFLSEDLGEPRCSVYGSRYLLVTNVVKIWLIFILWQYQLITNW